MRILDNILEAVDLVLEALDEFWDIGVIVAEEIVNATPLSMPPEYLLIFAIISFTVWLRL